MKKKFFVFFALLTCLGMLLGNITIQIKGEVKPVNLQETTLSSVSYVALKDFSAIFKAISKRIEVTIDCI